MHSTIARRNPFLVLGMLGLLACAPKGNEAPAPGDESTSMEPAPQTSGAIGSLGTKNATPTAPDSPQTGGEDMAGTEPAPTDTDGGMPAPTPDMAVNNNAVLTWTAPTMNTDGSPLTDLGGYWVYHGLASPLTASNAVDRIDVGNVLTYTFMNLVPGTHYFRVTSYNTAGVESDYSGEGSKIIPP